MKKIIFFCCVLYVLGATAFANQTSCQACTTGSPLIQQYVTWMNGILQVLNDTKSPYDSTILGQGVNVTTMGRWTNEWTELSQSNVITITNHSKGIKSDFQKLNNLQTSIDKTALLLINRKFIWENQIDASTKNKLLSLIQSQVGNGKILQGSGNRSSLSLTYREFMESLSSLQYQMIQLPVAHTGTVLAWKGYTSNSTYMQSIISYYSCAQSVVACRTESVALELVANNIVSSWDSILRSFNDMKLATKKSYRQTPSRQGSVFLLSNDTVDTFNDIVFATQRSTRFVGSSIGTVIHSTRKVITSAKITKEQRNKEQAIIDETKQIQGMIAQGNVVSIAPTNARAVYVQQAPEYSRREFDAFIAANNATVDQVLDDSMKRYAILVTYDSREFAAKIPDLMKQMYAVQGQVATVANNVYEECLQHCSNDPQKVCGSPVQSA